MLPGTQGPFRRFCKGQKGDFPFRSKQSVNTNGESACECVNFYATLPNFANRWRALRIVLFVLHSKYGFMDLPAGMGPEQASKGGETV
eukprot:6477945-Prymnesium_polylepis.1